MYLDQRRRAAVWSSIRGEHQPLFQTMMTQCFLAATSTLLRISERRLELRVGLHVLEGSVSLDEELARGCPYGSR